LIRAYADARRAGSRLHECTVSRDVNKSCGLKSRGDFA
jgi:hypothetical protein